ncbi:hypothetical protein [Pseudomonas lurida]|uniref:hypothetical protein n=1 Tax=Pseudomonas lurida TaxID=244566 RepID=UPI002733AB0F|nr:hypothetical protein [Pseudomonas lurida]WLG25990.1 hypothetical protein PSH68_14270 [Pseudomonas lurida]
MERKFGLINVFAQPYEVWTQRETSFEEAMDLVKNHDLHISQAMQVNDQLVEVVSTHFQAATRMLLKRSDNGLENHVNGALYASNEYRALRGLMPMHEPEALTSYQGSFTEQDWATADAAINAYGIEMSEGQILFHGGLWPSDSLTFTTTRPFSTSFCPQVALRNAEWRGKAFDAGRVDLMVVRVTQPRAKAYAYNLEGEHGNEKEIVFASGAKLHRVNETYVTDMHVCKVNSSLQEIEKTVSAYLVEVAIS